MQKNPVNIKYEVCCGLIYRYNYNTQLCNFAILLAKRMLTGNCWIRLAVFQDHLLPVFLSSACHFLMRRLFNTNNNSSVRLKWILSDTAHGGLSSRFCLGGRRVWFHLHTIWPPWFTHLPAPCPCGFSAIGSRRFNFAATIACVGQFRVGWSFRGFYVKSGRIFWGGAGGCAPAKSFLAPPKKNSKTECALYTLVLLSTWLHENFS